MLADDQIYVWGAHHILAMSQDEGVENLSYKKLRIMKARAGTKHEFYAAWDFMRCHFGEINPVDSYQIQGKVEVRGDDIHWCFQQLGLDRPKNLHNALGILKRKLGYLQEGSIRGKYQLSPSGVTYVEGQFLGS